MKVDFPAPFGPKQSDALPALTSRSSEANASNSPKRFATARAVMTGAEFDQLRPDREFISDRVGEMEPPSAGEREDRFGDFSANSFDFCESFLKPLTVKHDQHRTSFRGGRFV